MPLFCRSTVSGDLSNVMFKHKHADRGGQIFKPALSVDCCDELANFNAAFCGDFSQRIPESVLEAHISVVTSNSDPSSYNSRTFALPIQRLVRMIFIAHAGASCVLQLNARGLIGAHIPLNLSC